MVIINVDTIDIYMHGIGEQFYETEKYILTLRGKQDDNDVYLSFVRTTGNESLYIEMSDQIFSANYDNVYSAVLGEAFLFVILPDRSTPLTDKYGRKYQNIFKMNYVDSLGKKVSIHEIVNIAKRIFLDKLFVDIDEYR